MLLQVEFDVMEVDEVIEKELVEFKKKKVVQVILRVVVCIVDIEVSIFGEDDESIIIKMNLQRF